MSKLPTSVTNLGSIFEDRRKADVVIGVHVGDCDDLEIFIHLVQARPKLASQLAYGALSGIENDTAEARNLEMG